MKPLEQILAEATDEQIRAWMADFAKHTWPETMPVPAEAIGVCWHKMNRRLLP